MATCVHEMVNLVLFMVFLLKLKKCMKCVNMLYVSILILQLQ